MPEGFLGSWFHMSIRPSYRLWSLWAIGLGRFMPSDPSSYFVQSPGAYFDCVLILSVAVASHSMINLTPRFSCS